MQNLINDRRMLQSKATLQSMLEDPCRYSKGSQSRIIRSGAKTPNKCVMSPPALSSSRLSVREEKHAPIECSVVDEAAFGLSSIKIDLGESEQPKMPFHSVQKHSSPTRSAHLVKTNNSSHTLLSADGARVSFVTAKQTEAELQEFNRIKGVDLDVAHQRSLGKLTPRLHSLEVAKLEKN